LNSWGITVCEDPDLSCPATLTQSIYSSDFEADGGSFTHTVTANEWERGTPSAAPITTCHSGTNCWKTDLDGTYDASSNQELISPNIDLSTVAGRLITFQWAMKYQMEGVNWDHAFVEVREVGMPANAKRVFEHKASTQFRTGFGRTNFLLDNSVTFYIVTANFLSRSGYISRSSVPVFRTFRQPAT
jgi:hypothetical protein